MKLSNFLIVVVSAAVGAIAGALMRGGGDSNAKVAALEERIEKLENANQGADGDRLDALESKVEELERSFARLSSLARAGAGAGAAAGAEACVSLSIVRADWIDPSDRPSWIPAEAIKSDGSGHILAEVSEMRDDESGFYARADKTFVLRAPEVRDIAVRAERGLSEQQLYLHVSASEMNAMHVDVPYRLYAMNRSGECRWDVSERITLTRRSSDEAIRVAP